MKKYLLLVLSLVFLVGCGNGEVKPSTNQNVEPDVETVNDGEEIEEVKPVTNNDDPWKHIDVDVTSQYGDLDFNVYKVVVSNEMDYMDQKVKAIGTKWRITNNSADKRYNTYLGIATLITSDGEQTNVDLLASDSLGGEIFEGVTKEGNLTFILERSDVENLDWIKIVWQNTDGSIMNMKETEMTINLK